MGASLGETTIAQTSLVAQLGGWWVHLIDHVLFDFHARAAPENGRGPLVIASDELAIESRRNRIRS